MIRWAAAVLVLVVVGLTLLAGAVLGLVLVLVWLGGLP